MVGAREAHPKNSRKHALEIIRRLKQAHPDARCALHHSNALELLVATILSAQCTDERVNLVTKELFKKYRTAADYASAPIETLEEEIRSTGFYKNKAKAIKNMAVMLLEKHAGEVPDRMDALVELNGVGRKTANVVLGNVFHKNEGIVVDTHVKRLANRLGLSQESDAEKIEADLMAIVPREEWTEIAHLLIFHGRRVCAARKPKCESCTLNDICPASEIQI